MFKRILLTLSVICVMVSGLILFTGCVNNSIEGTWILVEEIESNGNKLSSEELKNMGISEQYVITGTEVVYTCELPAAKKPITITFELEDLGNNKYNFNLKKSITFATVEVKGNKMTYEVGEGDNATKMTFKRQ